MSPLKIKMLLHYYAHTTDYAAWAFEREPQHADSPAVLEALESFVGDGLLKSRFGDVAWAARQSVNDRSDGVMFSITEKGKAMVDHLCAVQLPVCVWVQPQ